MQRKAALTVWAPRATRVELVLGDRRLPMRPAAGGWFEAPEELPSGTDYAYSLDGADPVPDPRAPYLPRGVHGPARLVDHSTFRWTDAGWQPGALKDAVFYELHVGTFTPEGTFEAVIGKLDHLVRLGVTAVELMPFAHFPGRRNWGYDGVAIFAPHPVYGGPAGLKRLVNGCHERGLAVVADVVHNHLGPTGNYSERFGPYATDRYRTPWGSALNFDGPQSEEVRNFICDSSLMWLRDYHLDGLRLDAVHAIHDQSAVHILEELGGRVRELASEVGRPFYVIAESDLNDPRLVRPVELGGYGLDAQWSDDLHHSLHAVLTGERRGYYVDFGSLADVSKALRQVFVYDGRPSRWRGRGHGRPVGEIGGDRFLAFLQNHDQVGNRTPGDRVSALVSQGRLRIGAALLLCGTGVPLLFMGEEWGASTPFLFFTDHEDPSVADATRRGRAADAERWGWSPADVADPQALETFERSRLDWSEPEREPHCHLLEWYRSLIALRRLRPELRDGRRDLVGVDFDEAAGWLRLRRPPLTLACNLGPQVVALAAGGRLELASELGVTLAGGELRLPPDACALLHGD